MLSSHPALVGAGNVHVFTVFRDCATCYLDALPLQLGCPVLLLQVLPQAPQCDVELSGVSQPLVLGAAGKQSA